MNTKPVYAVSTRDSVGTYHFSTQPMINIDNERREYVIPRDVSFMRDISVGVPVKVYLTQHRNSHMFYTNPENNILICEFEFSITNDDITKLDEKQRINILRSITVGRNIYNLEMSISKYENQKEDDNVLYSIALPTLFISD